MDGVPPTGSNFLRAGYSRTCALSAHSLDWRVSRGIYLRRLLPDGIGTTVPNLIQVRNRVTDWFRFTSRPQHLRRSESVERTEKCDLHRSFLPKRIEVSALVVISVTDAGRSHSRAPLV